MKYSTILFDMDGTIIDSLDFHTSIFTSLLNNFGVNTAYNEVKPFMGKSITEVFNAFLPVQQHSDALKLLQDIYTNEVSKYIDKIRPIDTVMTTLPLLHKNLTLCLFTNSHQIIVKKILKKLNINDFDVVSGECKGSTHKIERCRQYIDNNNKHNYLYVGDTQSDIAMADCLGIDSCLVNTDYAWIDKDNINMSITPTYQIDSFDQLIKII